MCLFSADGTYVRQSAQGPRRVPPPPPPASGHSRSGGSPFTERHAHPIRRGLDQGIACFRAETLVSEPLVLMYIVERASFVEGSQAKTGCRIWIMAPACSRYAGRVVAAKFERRSRDLLRDHASTTPARVCSARRAGMAWQRGTPFSLRGLDLLSALPVQPPLRDGGEHIAGQGAHGTAWRSDKDRMQGGPQIQREECGKFERAASSGCLQFHDNARLSVSTASV